MRTIHCVCVFNLILSLMFSSAAYAGSEFVAGTEIHGERNFLTGYLPVNGDATVNVVVEIPAGTAQKWEVRGDGVMIRDAENGQPRSVKYLGYPGNYGMIPRTLGGDGDPLDVIVLGEPVPRGRIIRARVVGVLHFADGGETDDKIIAIDPSGPLREAHCLRDLTIAPYSGVTGLIRDWFRNYKGPGRMVYHGSDDACFAREMVLQAVRKFQMHQSR